MNDDHVRVHESLMEYLVASFIIDMSFSLCYVTNDHDSNTLQILQNCFGFSSKIFYSLFNHDINIPIEFHFSVLPQNVI